MGKFFSSSVKAPYDKLSITGKAARVAILTVKQFCLGKYTRQATALTYYTLFAIVPLAALSFGIAKGFSLENKLKQVLSVRFADHQETLNWIYKFADTTLKEASGGWIAGIGVLFLFFTVITLGSNVEETFNMIWSLRTKRNFIHRVRNYLAIMVVTPILIIVAGGAPVIEKTVNNALMKLSPTALHGLQPLLTGCTDIIPFIAVWLVFFLVYCFVPNTRVRPLSALIASFFAGGVFYLLQTYLLMLQGMLSKYNTIYGSFSMVPLFLLWLQWSWTIILFGAETAFVHQSASSGRFDRNGANDSRRMRRVCLLAVVRDICKKYAAGEGAASEADIRKDLQLSRYYSGELLKELCEGGIIMPLECESGEERSFVPAYPPEQLTPVRVMELLDSQGEAMPDPFAEPMLANILDTCRKLDEAAESCVSNRPLKDL